MNHFEPYPKKPLASKPQKFCWNTGKVHSFENVEIPQDVLFATVIEQRRSHRNLEYTTLDFVLSMVRHTLKVQQIGVGKQEGLFRKAVASAGALHPIEAIIFSPKTEIPPMIYCDEDDNFKHLNIVTTGQVLAFYDACAEILPNVNCHLILLTANLKLTEQRYKNSASLAWRDAGAVLQLMMMTTNALGLNSCPLGLLGEKIVSNIHGKQEGPVGVGVIAVGAEL